MTTLACPICIIDFEATCLPAAGTSYPIEVAVGFPANDTVRSWLIRPDPGWPQKWHWDPESQKLHRLTPEDLQAHGQPSELVFRELRAGIDGHAVLSDNEVCDQLSLARLAGGDPGVRLRSIVELYREMAGGDERLLERAFAHARTVAPKQHRAAANVRWHLAVYRCLAGGADANRAD